MKQFSFQKCFPANRWEEISREGNQKQIVLRIGHINPESKVNSKDLTPHNLPSANADEVIYVMGVHKLQGTMAQFFEAMEDFAASGYAPAYFTREYVNEMREKHNRIYPEKFDFNSTITIIDYGTEEMAKRELENIILASTHGLMETRIQSMGENIPLRELFQKDFMKSYITEEQIKQIEAASQEMKEKFSKAGLKYSQGEYQGYGAVFYKIPQRELKPKISKIKSGSEKRKGKAAIPSGGAEYDIGLSKGAFKPKESKDKDKCFEAVQAGGYIVRGGLLNVVNCFPLGGSFCQSLTKTQTKEIVSRENGKKLITKLIYPVPSTLAREGYLHKEEIDEIFSRIFFALTNN